MTAVVQQEVPQAGMHLGCRQGFIVPQCAPSAGLHGSEGAAHLAQRRGRAGGCCPHARPWTAAGSGRQQLRGCEGGSHREACGADASAAAGAPAAESEAGDGSGRGLSALNPCPAGAGAAGALAGSAPAPAPDPMPGALPHHDLTLLQAVSEHLPTPASCWCAFGACPSGTMPRGEADMVECLRLMTRARSMDCRAMRHAIYRGSLLGRC